MLENIFWLLIGAFVGWNVPQPQWAINLKAKVLSGIASIFKS